MNARKLNGCLLWLFVLALVVAAGLWATFESYKDYYAHVRPPVTGGTGENDRAAFLAAYSHSEPERVFLEGEECVLHFGHVPDRWSTRIVLPSGPPAYVFDRFGRLKKWFPDTGEGDFEAWYRTAARRINGSAGEDESMKITHGGIGNRGEEMEGEAMERAVGQIVGKCGKCENGPATP